METLGDRLKYEREKRGWSQVYIAEKLGMKRSSTYANWEYNIRQPDNEMLIKLSEVLEVSTDYLLGNSNKFDKIISNEEYDSLGEITNHVKQLGIEDMGFFDIEKWKNLSPEDVEMIKRHFEMVVELAEKRRK
ncbi:helix-turn-helix domain-containing protein [Bacillus cereus]|uniref:Uncharacterized protein n=1 Tax=Bacillus cereus TaxID=1396 RepID=A0A2C1ZEM1_BACCE|nr:helix-turn-helix transcriptional regulator [Bacillus cereus]MDM5239066.1 helix-turn-helix transcriptional regulator [Bacillus cereus]PEC19397.1 hypothetical protein COM96_25390 [Bacillus cereus]PGV55924.1 hypothetical protein COD94_28480 [Bacillus cereus]